MISEKQAIELYRNYNRAMVSGNTEELREILSTKYTLTHMTGDIESLDEWLTQIEDGEMHYLNSKEESIEIISTVDNKITLVGRNTVMASLYNGPKINWKLNSVVSISKNDSNHLLINQVVVTQY